MSHSRAFFIMKGGFLERAEVRNTLVGFEEILVSMFMRVDFEASQQEKKGSGTTERGGRLPYNRRWKGGHANRKADDVAGTAITPSRKLAIEEGRKISRRKAKAEYLVILCC